MAFLLTGFVRLLRRVEALFLLLTCGQTFSGLPKHESPIDEIGGVHFSREWLKWIGSGGGTGQ